MEKKSRILYLLKYLHESSDEAHPVSSTELMEYLESELTMPNRLFCSPITVMLFLRLFSLEKERTLTGGRI